MFTNCPGDDAFGPVVRGCRDDFDFTLRFERIVLSLIPTCLFLAASLYGLAVLLRRERGGSVKNPGLQVAKLAFWIAYSALSLGLLVLAAAGGGAVPPLLVASTATSLALDVCLSFVSYHEHRYSRRPSFVLCVYLLLTLLFDIVQIRSLWLSAMQPVEISFCRVYGSGLAVKAALLALEAQHKKTASSGRNESPEEKAGIFELGCFVWLAPVFRAGNKKRLFLDDMFPLPRVLSAETTQSKLLKHVQLPNNHISGFWLLKALGQTLSASLVLPIAPRLALTGFKFCQPFLIFSLLDYLRKEDAPKNHGYGLIGAAVFIYLGIAFSTSFYWYLHEQTLSLTRGALAGAIYRKTTQLPLTAASDSAALTLMSTDVERIRYGSLNLHEFWANTIEVAMASFLLYRQLGAAVAAPLVVVLCCIVGGAITNRFTKRRQKEWMAKIQKRVALTAEAISNMKSLKMSGLAPIVESLIQSMRVDELHLASRYRLVYVIVIGFGYAPTALCSVMTFAVTSKDLDVTAIFTSLSYLFLLADPLGYIFQNTPHLIAAIACLERIQAFLEQQPQFEYRHVGRCNPSLDEKGNPSNAAATITDGHFGWAPDILMLTKINLAMPVSSLTMVVGPVASGKSTLCKVLVGAVPVARGRVCIHLGEPSSEIAYCEQDPYLWNGSIRENIVGFSPFNEKRYHEVLDAVALIPDLTILPDGDQTRAWGSGSTLSGGQRQRVSLARALYTEAEMLVVDDVLGGLDEGTAAQVFLRTFGPDGLIRRRGATAILCTHAIKWLSFADHAIVLRDGTILEQGKPADLSTVVQDLAITKSEDEPDSTGGEEQVNDPLEPMAAFVPQVGENYIDEEDRMTGDSTVYKHYLSSLGRMSLLVIVVSALGWGFFCNFANIWLTFWSKDVSSGNPLRTNGFYIGIYGLFQMLFLFSMVLCFLVCYRNGIAASGAQLHHGALSTLIQAPLSFFSKADTGTVTSLFSQDMTLLDNELPVAVANLALDACNALGMAAVIATASPYLAITYPPLLVLYYFVQKYYLRTSRQLRLLDLEAKAPLYTHYLDTIRGLATLRAFRWTENGITQNNEYLEASQRPAYLLAMIQRALMFVLQLAVALLAVVVVTLATQLKTGGAFTGASLVTLMTFGDVLNYCIRWWTQIETSIGAVSRLKGFREKVPSESRDGEDVVPDESWPLRGAIDINGVSASYFSDNTNLQDPPSGLDEKDLPAQNLSLNNITLSISAGEKVAICGRTGSGKSSLILLLVRLLDPQPHCLENITIDGISLHKIDRYTLRDRFVTIPQEPCFLPDGTSIYANLDPYNHASEPECQSVLETVGLWPSIQSLGGLQAFLYISSLSQGQKQLFSLARAVLKCRARSADSLRSLGTAVTGGVLLVDEVSSTVDNETEQVMMEVIEGEFAGYTVVMVSHRLEMVKRFDRLVVMDKGRLVETARPGEMIGRVGGVYLNCGR